MNDVRRGSVAVLALIMVVSTAALAITMVALSGAVRTKQVRLQSNRVIQDAFDGGVDIVRDMAARGILRLPQTVTTTVGSVNETLALTEVTGQTISLGGVTITPSAPTILVSGTLTYRGDTYRRQQIIGRGLLSTVWQYAIYDDSGENTNNVISTGSPGYEGDAWFGGDLSLSSSSHIEGDLTSTKKVSSACIVDGKTTEQSPSISFPTVDASLYQAAAVAAIPGGTINGYVFPSATADGYPVVYVSGSLSISGSFSGSGVIFVSGNVTVTGDITTSAGCHLVIISAGLFCLNTTVRNISAYIYSGGNFKINSGGITRTVVGGIVAKDIILGDDISASFDPLVRDLPAEAYNLKLPGVWP